MSDVILQTQGLAIGYGDKMLGREIELAIGSGEIFCLLGANGAGKTTLFKTLLGLIPSLAGEIRLAGRAMSEMRRRDIARLLAYVPQSHSPPFPYCVVDVVLMGCASRTATFSSPTQQDRRQALTILQDLGMEELAEEDYSHLSGGQRQMVMIARAMMQQARILVLDEPTAGLDYGNQVRVLKLVRRLADQGMAIVMATHHPDHVFALGDRVALFFDGGLAVQGVPAEVMTQERLQALYQTDLKLLDSQAGHLLCVPEYR